MIKPRHSMKNSTTGLRSFESGLRLCDSKKADTINVAAAIFKCLELKGGGGGRGGAPVEGSLRDLLCYRELIVDVGNARYLHSRVGDFLFLRDIFHVTAQCNSTVAC